MHDLTLPDYLYTTFVRPPRPMSSSSEPLSQWFPEHSPMTFLQTSGHVYPYYAEQKEPNKYSLEIDG